MSKLTDEQIKEHVIQEMIDHYKCGPINSVVVARTTVKALSELLSLRQKVRTMKEAGDVFAHPFDSDLTYVQAVLNWRKATEGVE